MKLDDLTNKIHQADCIEFMKQIPSGSIDMILCDLPYGTTNCSWDTVISFESLWKAYKRIIKDNGAIILTASQPFTSALVMSNIKMFKYEWIWEKTQATGYLDAKEKPIADRQKLKMIKKYDLYHKGKIIMSSNEVKELKWFVQEYERKRGNRVFATYTYMMNVLLKEREK